MKDCLRISNLYLLGCLSDRPKQKKMALKLYGSKMSTCTQRVMLVLNELSLSYELVDINMMKGEHKVILVNPLSDGVC